MNLTETELHILYAETTGINCSEVCPYGSAYIRRCSASTKCLYMKTLTSLQMKLQHELDMIRKTKKQDHQYSDVSMELVTHISLTEQLMGMLDNVLRNFTLHGIHCTPHIKDADDFYHSWKINQRNKHIADVTATSICDMFVINLHQFDQSVQFTFELDDTGLYNLKIKGNLDLIDGQLKLPELAEAILDGFKVIIRKDK